MRFSDIQIELAKQLKTAGLKWQPKRGQYALDPDEKIEPGSPFQPRVYYFHDFQCFVDYFGSTDELASCMVWLPTFEECCELVLDKDRLSSTVCKHFNNHRELDGIYRLLLTELGTG